MQHPIVSRSVFAFSPLLRSGGLLALFAAVPVAAVDYYWDGNGGSAGAGNTGGDGVWTRQSNTWRNGSNTATPLTNWGGGAHSGDTAVFADLPGLVVNGGGANGSARIFVGNLRFDVGGYTLSGGTLTLRGSGNTSRITVNGGGATIGSTLANHNNSAYGIIKDGDGVLILSGSNQYTGATVVNAGTLRIGGDTDIDVINRASVLTVNAGATVDFGTYAEDTNVLTLDGGTITGGAGGALGVITTRANAGRGFDVRRGLADVVLSNPFRAETGDATAVGLTKSTNGVAILTRTNTYTGATSIVGGTLVVNGSTAQGSAVTVGIDTQAGTRGVLAGTGTINGSVTVSGGDAFKGTLSPGAVALDGTASIGVLRTGGETWLNGGAMEWQVNSTGGTAGINFDHLQIINGGLSLAGLGANGFTLRVIGLDGSTPGAIAGFDGTWNPNRMTTYSWTLVSAAGGITGFDASKFQIDLSGFTNAYDSGHGRFFVGLSGTNNLVLTYESIPEPATYAALLGGATLAVAGVRNWRRRRVPV